ncbi:MAG: undecaprenyl-diphosphate phosphatase [Atopobiaceae bacterium]|jgi:undecaprenyl-diphosphatase|nr:undecaprenyl-diphosphate phosphatase [Atopobiaceae bacterium]MCH4119427.1 undecaprenyl-diphosphate phosphatase [Atopobiaceae bacterium]MCI1318392.1 undecaprenyl-diphosphate phosphatase [Atopobiaceae bacterium]MCI1389014.1 undecaprenyl-diphosphate phosphatase [Atopobiaceae bacterium]MCI1431752.1 undecaprenyl-diphosphate phosphatase [Atopobiaceae bacterium]
MDLVQLLIAAVYGIVEGVTEWLPISSTGHMLLLQQFLALDVSKDFWDMFLVVIQLGAIIAVIVVFFDRINPFSGSKDAAEKRDTWSLWGKTIVACLPAAIVGIPLDSWMEENLGSPFVIAAALIVYGVAFILIEDSRERAALRIGGAGQGGGQLVHSAGHRPRHMASSPDLTATELADAEARVKDIRDLDWKTVLGIGLFQVLSIVPGTSRSGSTIIGGLLLGCSRAVAAEFTFYLAIPVMFGASGLRLVRFFLKGNAFTTPEAAILLVGCAVAFVISLACIRFLMGFVRKHDFKPFGWYRIVLGALVIVWFGLLA